jgi:hypothetical protein
MRIRCISVDPFCDAFLAKQDNASKTIRTALQLYADKHESLQAGDIVQLDPEQSPWGPLLCIVTEVCEWGVKCFWLQADERDKPPLVCHYRAKTGTFEVVGSARWVLSATTDTQGEG